MKGDPAIAAAGDADAALIAAAREFYELEAQIAALRAAGTYDEDTEIDPAFTRWMAAMDLVGKTAPTTIAGCAVKLRVLMHEEVGLPTGESEYDMISLEQVRDFLLRAAGEPGGLDALLMTWVALRESCTGKTDEEVERITDEMESVERQVLAGNPTTEADWRALAAMAVAAARDGFPFANTDVVEDLFQRLVVERMTDPICRSRAQSAADRDPFAHGGADPLIALGAERLRIEARLNTPGLIDDDAAEGESAELNEVDEQIASLVPTSAAGAAIQVRLLQHHMTAYAWDGSHDQLTENLLAWIERLEAS